MRYAVVFAIYFIPTLVLLDGVLDLAAAPSYQPAVSMADDVCDPGSQRPECSHLAAAQACHQMPDASGAGIVVETAFVAVELGCSVQP